MSTIINAPITIDSITISAPVSLGAVGATGKSQYQSYLDTTDDDPVLSEAAWSAATEGGGGVTDHGALDGLLDSDDHPQYHNDERGDARYPSITYAGANPNYPQTLTLTSVVTAGVNGTLVYCGLINGKPAWSSDGTQIAGVSNPSNTRVSSGAAGDIWLVERGEIYAANKSSTAATPAGLTGWLVVLGSGQPVIAASITAPSLPVGTHIGQLCQASGGLWRWNGSAWVEITTTASSISNAAVLAALPSTTPLPITSGGTGGDTQSAARTALGLGVEQSPTFAGLDIGTVGGKLKIPANGSTTVPTITTTTPGDTSGLSLTGNGFLRWTSTGILVLNIGNSSANFYCPIWVTSTTESTSVVTGSLRTAGGLAVGKNANIGGNLTAIGSIKATIPAYTNDAAADADAGLLSGQLYKITDGRTVYQKP